MGLLMNVLLVYVIVLQVEVAFIVLVLMPLYSLEVALLRTVVHLEKVVELVWLLLRAKNLRITRGIMGLLMDAILLDVTVLQLEEGHIALILKSICVLETAASKTVYLQNLVEASAHLL